MSSEPETPETAATDSAVATIETPETPEGPEKLDQAVEITDAGPCRKHIKVTVQRGPIDKMVNDRIKELVQSSDANIRGFRPGKAPRKIIEQRYGKEVNSEVKTTVLMTSLEQLATDMDISPLSSPDINPNKIEIPSEGPLVYEFDVEVRPEFDLPDYKSLKLNRPVQTFTDADVAKERNRLLEPAGQLVPREGDAAVELGDIVTADGTIRDGERVLNDLKEVRFRVDKTLALSDGVAEGFDQVMVGAKAGDEKSFPIKLSESVADASLRGKTVDATFKVTDIKTVRLPELTPELLEQFGVSNAEQLDELIRASLERRLEYAQRQSARGQVLEQIGGASQWDLPRDLLARQARKTLQRRIMEMKNAGMSDEQILGRRRLLEQDVIQSTAAALKEHFVLQKIAEVEKLEVEDSDIDDEIDRIALRADDSPRRVRARLEKEDMIETLAMELLERKALDLVLSTATYTDVPLVPDDADAVGTASAQAVAGELADPTATAEAEAQPAPAPEGESSPTA